MPTVVAVSVSIISACNIRSHPPLPEQPQQQLLPLTPLDLALLSIHYIQYGLLFHMPHPQDHPIAVFVDRLKHSLSRALAHFFPLAGRLVIQKADDDDASSSIFINCNGAGAEFIHAAAGYIYVAHLLATSTGVHPIIEAFFPLNQVISHDGHSLPLLAAQLTQLGDGFFLALSFSHVVGAALLFETSSIHGRRSVEQERATSHALRSSNLGFHPIRLPFSNPAEMVEER
ncbi:hypothetical protein ACLOJK_010515 [Asimina triloba]